jgi:hypothetical protein
VIFWILAIFACCMILRSLITYKNWSWKLQKGAYWNSNISKVKDIFSKIFFMCSFVCIWYFFIILFSCENSDDYLSNRMETIAKWNNAWNNFFHLLAHCADVQREWPTPQRGCAAPRAPEPPTCARRPLCSDADGAHARSPRLHTLWQIIWIVNRFQCWEVGTKGAIPDSCPDCIAVAPIWSLFPILRAVAGMKSLMKKRWMIGNDKRELN